MVLVNCVLAVLLNLYFGLIGSYQTQLTDLAANTPIKCTITNPDGTMEVGIAVSSDTLRELQAAEQIKDMDCSTRLKAGFGEFEEALWGENLNLDVSAVNKIDSTVLPKDSERIKADSRALIKGRYRSCQQKSLCCSFCRVCWLRCAVAALQRQAHRKQYRLRQP